MHSEFYKGARGDAQCYLAMRRCALHKAAVKRTNWKTIHTQLDCLVARWVSGYINHTGYINKVIQQGYTQNITEIYRIYTLGVDNNTS